MVTQPIRRLFGMLPRPSDPRELRYRQLPAATAPDPSIDRTLLAWLPPVQAQEMGDCVAQSTCTALLTCASMAGHDLREISRLALYAWGRQDMGTWPIDGGMYPAQGCDSVRKRSGDCIEELAPYANNPAYDPGAVQLADCPNQDWLGSHQPFFDTDRGGYDEGIMTALDAYRPVLIGMQWFDSFDVGANGILPRPGGKSVGYHEVCCYGRHPTSAAGEAVIAIRNSWGRWWGADGDFFVPISYLGIPGLFIDMRAVVGSAAEPQPASFTCTLVGPSVLAPGVEATYILGVDGSIQQPLWFVDWNDGTTTSWTADNRQAHAFSAPGTYAVTAWVWDAATKATSAPTALDVTAAADVPATVEMQRLEATFSDGSQQILYERGG